MKNEKDNIARRNVFGPVGLYNNFNMMKALDNINSKVEKERKDIEILCYGAARAKKLADKAKEKEKRSKKFVIKANNDNNTKQATPNLKLIASEIKNVNVNLKESKTSKNLHNKKLNNSLYNSIDKVTYKQDKINEKNKSLNKSFDNSRSKSNSGSKSKSKEKDYFKSPTLKSPKNINNKSKKKSPKINGKSSFDYFENSAIKDNKRATSQTIKSEDVYKLEDYMFVTSTGFDKLKITKIDEETKQKTMKYIEGNLKIISNDYKDNNINSINNSSNKLVSNKLSSNDNINSELNSKHNSNKSNVYVSNLNISNNNNITNSNNNIDSIKTNLNNLIDRKTKQKTSTIKSNKSTSQKPKTKKLIIENLQLKPFDNTNNNYNIDNIDNNNADDIIGTMGGGTVGRATMGDMVEGTMGKATMGDGTMGRATMGDGTMYGTVIDMEGSLGTLDTMKKNKSN